MKAGSLIFLFVSNRIKLPLSPTTISTTHANEVRRRNRPNLPVRNLDFCCCSSPPQQPVGLTGGKVAQVSFSFLIRSVSRECVQQKPATALYLVFHLVILLLCSVERRQRLRTVLTELSRGWAGNNVKRNSGKIVLCFTNRFNNRNKIATHLFGNTQVWALLCNYIKSIVTLEAKIRQMAKWTYRVLLIKGIEEGKRLKKRQNWATTKVQRRLGSDKIIFKCLVCMSK
jgi:hypothetical protein